MTITVYDETHAWNQTPVTPTTRFGNPAHDPATADRCTTSHPALAPPLTESESQVLVSLLRGVEAQGVQVLDAHGRCLYDSTEPAPPPREWPFRDPVGDLYYFDRSTRATDAAFAMLLAYTAVSNPSRFVYTGDVR